MRQTLTGAVLLLGFFVVVSFGLARRALKRLLAVGFLACAGCGGFAIGEAPGDGGPEAAVVVEADAGHVEAQTGWEVVPALIVALGLCALLGALFDFVILRRLRARSPRGDGLPPNRTCRRKIKRARRKTAREQKCSVCISSWFSVPCAGIPCSVGRNKTHRALLPDPPAETPA